MGTDYVSIDELGLTPAQRKAVGFLAEFTQQMVLLAFSEHNATPASASNLIKEIYRVTDDMVTGSLARSETKLPCKKGCSHCCALRVRATPLEVMGIANYLQSHLKREEISALQQRLAKAVEKTEAVDDSRSITEETMCPLLVDNSCTVYPVRPLACRLYHSLDSSDCELQQDKDDRLTIRPEIFCLSIGILAGLIEGLRTLGLQTRQLELRQGLRIEMNGPGSGLMEKWLAGEPVFAEAEMENAEKVERFYRSVVEKLGKPLS